MGNFDYFKEHPRGKEVRPVTALSTKIFLIRLEQYKIFEENNDQEHLELVRKKIIQDIKSLPMDSISVKEKKTAIDTALEDKFWKTLGREPIEFLKKEIAPIMKFKANVNQNEAQFTLKCEQYLLATLKEDKKTIEDCTDMIAKYALSIPRNLPDTKPKIPVLDMVIPLPPLTEQHKISRTLTNANLDILENQKYGFKLKIIKKGMMQRLLTGLVRVNV